MLAMRWQFSEMSAWRQRLWIVLLLIPNSNGGVRFEWELPRGILSKLYSCRGRYLKKIGNMEHLVYLTAFFTYIHIRGGSNRNYNNYNLNSNKIIFSISNSNRTKNFFSFNSKLSDFSPLNGVQIHITLNLCLLTNFRK